MEELDIDFKKDIMPEYDRKGIKDAGIANNFLKKLTDKRITLPEFEREIAYWFMTDFIEKVHYRALPTKTYQVINLEEQLQKLRVRSRRTSIRFDEDLFFEKQMKWEVQEYYEERNRIQNINNGNLLWLQDIRKIIPVEDISSHDKLDEKINDFKKLIEEEDEEIEENERY